jgi:hypothetical protein
MEEQGLRDLLPQEYLCDCSCDVCYELFSDARIVDALNEIVQHEEACRVTAYARV